MKVLYAVLGAGLLEGWRRLHRWLFTPLSFNLQDYRADRPAESLTPTRWQLFTG